MSATLLYHMLGIRGYRLVKQKAFPEESSSPSNATTRLSRLRLGERLAKRTQNPIWINSTCTAEFLTVRLPLTPIDVQRCREPTCSEPQ